VWGEAMGSTIGRLIHHENSNKLIFESVFTDVCKDQHGQFACRNCLMLEPARKLAN
jgi:hypothetical protein